MTSEKLGAVKEIQKEALNAFCFPFFNHALNLTISVSSSSGLSIRNSIGVIKEIIAFLTSSAKRRVLVDSICVRKIKKLCEKRWIKRVKALADFSSSFEAIIDILDEISE
jgi:siroheme synthase (precorrin-2 oxidase/ferrochelatase)